MSEKVVPLRGELAPQKPQVNGRLVEEIERVLEAARSREIVGMAGTYLHKDRSVSYAFAGLVGPYGVIGGVECKKARLLQTVLGR